MGVLKVVAAAVEAVCGPEVTGLKVMVDVLDVHHLGRMKVQLVYDGNHLEGLLAGFFVLYAKFAVSPHPLNFFGKEGEVELSGVEARKVASLQPLRDLRKHLYELGAVHKVFVLDAVYLRRLRIDGNDAAVGIVPGLYLPGFHPGFPARERLHKTKLNDAVRGNIKPGALYVKKEQRAL